MNKKLRALKAQRTKLLNKECETTKQFEEVQDKLNAIEFEMMLLLNTNHVPHID